ncbi:MAG: hypothetical protein IT332_02465 [Ardenticatenales bacterium]|nr:hypothetical protein [Ardenticatenales bacterium]
MSSECADGGWPGGAGILVANLDADHDFETTLGLTRTVRRPSPRARDRAVELGRWLAALTNPGDRMIGIGGDRDREHEVEAWRAADGQGADLPNVPVLAWAETRAVADLRAVIRRANGDRPPPAHRPTGHAVVDALWSIQPPDAVITARCNHRGFGLRLARELGEALPGAALVRSRGEVAMRVGQQGDSRREAVRVGATACVVKAVCSSAGRDRVWVPLDGGDGVAEREAIDTQLDRLFERHGEAVIEPWLDRTDDFGAVGYVDDAGRVQFVGLHRMRVDGRGRFRGIDVPAAEELDGGTDGEADGVADGGAAVRLPVGLLPGEAARLREVHRAVGVALAGAGYRGAFGIDAFRWRDAAERIRLHALGEVNARVTMGLLAHIAADRLARSPSEGRTPFPQQPQPVDDHEQARADVGEDRHPEGGDAG